MKLLFSNVHWLDDHLLPCAYKQLFGIDCPFCGSQRALIELLKGNVIGSIKLYPALIPTLILIASVFLQLILKSKQGWKHIRFMLKADFALIMISYILKLLNVY
jgi:hypothetical protein